MSRQLTISLEGATVTATQAALRETLGSDLATVPQMILGLSLAVVDIGSAADHAAQYLQVVGHADPDPVWREVDSRAFRVAVVVSFKTGSEDADLARVIAEKLARELTRRLGCRAILAEDESALGVWENGRRSGRPPPAAGGGA